MEKIKKASNNTVEFGKRLFGFVIALVAVVPVVVGIYVAWFGQHRVQGAESYGVLFTAGMTIIAGLFVLYRVLMRKEA